MILLLEELMFNLTKVCNRSDTEATEFKCLMNLEQVLAILDERVDASGSQPAGENTVVVDFMEINHKLVSVSMRTISRR